MRRAARRPGAQRRPSATGRGVVLLAALMVLAMASVIGTGMAWRAEAGVEGTRFRLHEAQARSAAWSGVLAVMGELSAQRQAVLAGGVPTLTASFRLSRPDDAVVVSARVVAREGEGGAVPQARSLGINSATSDMLVATGLLSARDASRLAARATERPFTSVEELRVAAHESSASMTRPGPAPPKAGTPGEVTKGSPDSTGASWDRIFSAYSFDPEVCAGVGDAARSGETRLTWAQVKELKGDRTALTRLFQAEVATAIDGVISTGTQVTSRADLVGAMRRAGLDARYWGVVLDRVRAQDDEFVTGRIDITGAGAEVLACLPGVGPEGAASLVKARDRVDETARRSLAWPVTEGVMTPDTFQAVVDRLTTRSAQFRVRVEGAVAPRSREGEGAVGEEASRAAATVVYDAIIDVSSEPPRVAYLRDATLGAAAEHVRGRVPASRAARGADRVSASEGSAPDLDLGDRRAEDQNVAVPGPTPDSQGVGGSESRAVDRTQGRVGRWTAPARPRGDGG